MNSPALSLVFQLGLVLFVASIGPLASRWHQTPKTQRVKKATLATPGSLPSKPVLLLLPAPVRRTNSR